MSLIGKEFVFKETDNVNQFSIFKQKEALGLIGLTGVFILSIQSLCFEPYNEVYRSITPSSAYKIVLYTIITLVIFVLQPVIIYLDLDLLYLW